jgi:carboxymethylenebutenolidase
MCFDLEARPPIPPIRGAAVDGRDLLLTSADETRFAAFATRAAQSGGPGVVIIPDVRGLHPYYEELALRFAEAGVHAVAIDLYARTAGAEKRGEGFDHEPHARQARLATATEDVAAAAELLRSAEGGEAERLFTLGFCFGGRISFLQAGEGHGLAGAIGFYGWPVGPHRTGLPAPAEAARRFDCPVLAIYGGADEGIPPAAVAEFDDALASAGVAHRSVVYDGAPHSFFDRRAEDFADASENAWRQVLDFMGVGRLQEPGLTT